MNWESLKVRINLFRGVGFRKAYGQFGEDIVAQKLLKSIYPSKKKPIFYIDIGAYHPVLLSNTYAMYTQGGNGIVIEPNPALKNIFESLRPRDTFLNVGLGKAGEATYYLFKQSAHNTFSLEESEKKKSFGIEPTGTLRITVKTLTQVVQENDVKNIDFLSIDIEGKEMEVFQEYDWSILPAVICVESRYFDTAHPEEDAVYRFLIAKGYTLKSYLGQCLFFALTKLHS